MPTFNLPSANPGSPFLGGDDVVMSLVPITPPLTQQWGIYDMNGVPVFATGTDGNIDTLLELKHSDNAKVSTFPVEQGQFASYNKTGTPFSPKVGIAVGGQDRITILTDKLEKELSTINLYQIITPEHTYSKVTLEKYEYVRSQKSGRNLLHVMLTFIQVIEVIPGQYAQTAIVTHAKKKGAEDKKGEGKAQTSPLSAAKALYNARLIKLGGKPGDPGSYDVNTGKRIIK